MNNRRCIRIENKDGTDIIHITLTRRLIVMAGGDRSVSGSWWTTTTALVTDVASLIMMELMVVEHSPS